jgi:hypothetical protein
LAVRGRDPADRARRCRALPRAARAPRRFR